jgi:hypothetical protein
MCTALLATWYREDPEAPTLHALLGQTQLPGRIFSGAPNANPFRELSQLLQGTPPPRYIDPEWLTRLYATYYRPHVPFDREALLRAWAQCGRPNTARTSVAAGSRARRALLDRGLWE